jgi:molecular chaperone DnaK
VRLGDRVLSLPEISAYIMSELKDVAEGQLDCEITDAVISVPAYYNDNQRNAVKKAGELAGLNVLRIVNEPTSAAMAYGFNRQLKERILVFDLGGGTFDVSVLEIAGNIFRVIATGGDTFLGGADFDRRVIFDVLRRFKQEHELDLNPDKVAMQRVKNAAEKAKKDLSFQDEVTMSLPYIARKNNNPVDLVMKLTRPELQNLTMDLIRRTLDLTSRVLESKKLTSKDIDEVLLVGGQTRMPLVRKMVEDFFGKEPRRGVHPDEVVALGAALLADSLKRESLVKLQDVLSMPIGIAIPGGKFKIIVDKNTSLPHRKDYKLSNLDPNQKKLEIDIYQGDSDKIIANEYIGTFTFDFSGIANKENKVQLAMAFSLTEESLLTVVATDQQSGKSYQSTMVTKDTPETLKEAIKLEMKQNKNDDKSNTWLPDFAKKMAGKG